MASDKTRFGLSCAITTPMREGGGVDLPRLVRHARHVLAQGCDSVTLFGTTGEGAALGLPARTAMMGALIGAGIDPATRIHAGIAAASMHEAIEQSRLALDAGAKGLLVAPPFYFKGVGDEGLYAWFSQFLEKLGGSARNVILYHIPSVTAVEISVGLVQRLKTAFPGLIAGVKDSSGDYANTEALLKAHGELAILVGDERQLARAVRNGAQGTICGVANLVPALLRPMVYEGKDSPVVNALVDEICSYPVLAAVKALTGHVHGDAGYGAMRPPLEALDEATRKRLFAAFDSITQAKAA
ncbi:dihydrodipicolinate synthase family protein [Bosea sp. (in: a-proteobacteria)]|uniref:dihydrodipicolinate synthase family protein n=1 Tax=Bosea sp. (in: a-proteobacteria) TaxID=1871050 RepID=UPI001AD394B5|nr:dihydrodipicolinate synthase family protein [Bosea sp. (in: a-proteobacteria)]MBN9441756.1 dihydrodipicolinate synthase family protein [Bosea sp. (in: a-proteobacteria)]